MCNKFFGFLHFPLQKFWKRFSPKFYAFVGYFVILIEVILWFLAFWLSMFEIVNLTLKH